MKGEVKLGILGGGQLGRMLMQAGLDFNLYTLVLDPDENAPCKDICNEFYVGSFRDFETVYEFGKNCDIITIEIEHVNADALEKLEQEGVKVYPDAQTVRTIQDKGLQKEFYKKHNIPTSDFLILKDKAELEDNLHFLPAFQKLRREGYDGRGVKRLGGVADTLDAFEEPSVLEKLVTFEKEISVIVARNESGEVTAFPVVELSFHPEHNLVDSLFAPANVPYKLQRLAIEIATRVIESFNMVGILAVEMFLTKDGQILVNEVAPRPHNSGHHTIKANYTSQYEQHLRAILNLPLGSTEIQSAAVMLNLLGEPGYDGEARYEGLQEALAVPGVYIHLYGKKYTRPARKMGHITVLGKDVEEAQERAEQVKNVIKVKA
ncbi:5-(carboxyamino)imidazole ribonucleotide synthase [Pontibacter cellulosilyticus]|uniref:N5-carboxyaminoimidazole ribonucleotide synthase n=1 Tax=Pontibacter cellulosilyticus TaxID=1720253 RepID=A0A923SJ18_9BACT|nr:5-(carboxyamino)imidazole ribonucleotide synthase [Pontibacter cellulosilyticus]MBC5993429.1 5-(carboxyamino)imidazole ribonucleotide synthase [Pontibacter cellulosilyticus]